MDELWKTPVSRFRDRLILAGNQYEQRYGEPLGLLMLHDDRSELVEKTRQGMLYHELILNRHRYKQDAGAAETMTLLNDRKMGHGYGVFDNTPYKTWRELYWSCALLDENHSRSVHRLITDGSLLLCRAPWTLHSRFTEASRDDGRTLLLWYLFEIAWQNLSTTPLNAGRWFIDSPIPPCPVQLFREGHNELPGCFFSRIDDFYNSAAYLLDWILAGAPDSHLDQPIAGNSVAAPMGKETTDGVPVEAATPEMIVLNDTLIAVLKKLDGKAMRLEALANEVTGGDSNRLYRDGLLTTLVKTRQVVHDRRIGYYRPDKPPIGRVVTVTKVGAK